MKRFENVKYVPAGFVREIQPITNRDLDSLSVDVLNKTSNIDFKKGNIEVISSEITKVTSVNFNFFETHYKVLIPLNDNMMAETASKMSIEGNGWERIRNSVVESVMQYDSTVKLWDATRRDSTLFQPLPHTIYYEDKDDYYFKLQRKGIPFSLKEARREYKNAIQLIHAGRDGNHLDSWNFNAHMRRRLTKILKITSHVNPRSAIYSNSLNRNVRHSLKTELLNILEVNTGNLGLLTKGNDTVFANLISDFQKPTEEQLALTFTTCYKTSIYANCPAQLIPAVMYDSNVDGKMKNCTAVEFEFILQNLVTAWIRKFDNMHLFSHETAIRDVLDESSITDDLEVLRSNTTTANRIRNSIDENKLDDCHEPTWSGFRRFREFRIKKDKDGLRERINANTDDQ